MQHTLLIAAIIAVLVGVIHSILGEVLIFRKLRHSGVVPDQPAPPLQARHVKILWATWHLASAFGFGFAAILWHLSKSKTAIDPSIVRTLSVSFLVGALLVFFATRGKHPGWIGLLVVAMLVQIGVAA